MGLWPAGEAGQIDHTNSVRHPVNWISPECRRNLLVRAHFPVHLNFRPFAHLVLRAALLLRTLSEEVARSPLVRAANHGASSSSNCYEEIGSVDCEDFG